MGGIERRTLLGAGAGLAVLGVAQKVDAARPDGLNAVAAQRGMRFGACTSYAPPGADAGSFNNPAYAALLKADCGLLVPENELKWQATRPAPDRFDFARVDAMLDWAEAHGMAMRGHTLFWHKTRYYPKWLLEQDFGSRPAAAADRILTQHVDTILHRYGTRIGAYDVVNEAVDEKDGSLRDSDFARAFGGTQALLDRAFHLARAAAPHAQLVYNDYMSWEPGNEAHRAGVLKLLEGFRARNVPVDALGVQSHIAPVGAEAPGLLAARQEKPWRAFLDAVVAMGYKLVVTEFDVADNALPSAIAERDRKVADYADAYLEIMLGYPQLRDVLAWGMCDKYSWLTGFRPRSDFMVVRGTPYDPRFRPKPLHGVIAKRLAGTAKRTV